MHLNEPPERFIPISLHEIIDDLVESIEPHNEQERKLFKQFCTLFSALYHYKFHSRAEQLKRYYQPFNPDADTLTKHLHTDQELKVFQTQLNHELCQLLNNANYEELTIDDINQAMNTTSPYGVEVSVDLNDFSQMILYARGAGVNVIQRRTWKSFFLREESLEIPIYKRLFLLIQFKNAVDRIKEFIAQNPRLSATKAAKKIARLRQDLPNLQIDNYIFLKLFKDIPRSDLETLFPNQRVRLKLFDKIKLAITGGGGTIGGLIAFIGKAGLIAVNPVAFLMAFGGLIGVIFRQVTNIFYHRNKYTMVLSRHLYFHNLDNNLGVINHLIDLAEEEECKEAILAYYFLYFQKDKLFTQTSLDQSIEHYLQQKYGVTVDFEVDDGLRKLECEGLLQTKTEILSVLALHEACECLDKQWDHFFEFYSAPAKT